MPQEILTVGVYAAGPFTTVAAFGEADMSSAPKLTAALDTAMRQAGAAIQLDVRGLKFLDSSGVGVGGGGPPAREA
jgi:anti-sigma B factor antagonist